VDFGHFDSADAKLNPIVTSIVGMLSLNKKVTARGEWYRILPWGDSARLREVRKQTYALLNEAIDAAPVSGITDLPIADAALKASCVVDFLLNAVDEKGERFPRGLVLANMIVFTGAGYTTTLALLSWLIYCLVTYPETQQRLLQELVDYGYAPDME